MPTQLDATVDVFARIDFGPRSIDATQEAVLNLPPIDHHPPRPSTWAPDLDAAGVRHPGWDANCNVGCFRQLNDPDDAGVASGGEVVPDYVCAESVGLPVLELSGISPG